MSVLRVFKNLSMPHFLNYKSFLDVKIIIKNLD